VPSGLLVRTTAAAAAAFLTAGCGGGGDRTASGTQGATCPTRGRHVSFPLLGATTKHDVEVDTNLGTFSFALDVKDSPCTTSWFASLVRKGFFDGLTFHRIVPGFVIQGGDPSGNGSGGPGYTVVDTPPRNAAYTRGVVAMAKTGADPAGTAGSQFFVVTGADAGLPPQYALLGRVTRGLDVVERIGRLGNAQEQPTRRIVIRRMTLTP
jgi:cyclophilin family peptidyl-prolyl cis-trans isomerase